MKITVSLQEIAASANLYELRMLREMIDSRISIVDKLTTKEKSVAMKNKINAIKMVMGRTGLDLRECRDMVYSALGLNNNGDKL